MTTTSSTSVNPDFRRIGIRLSLPDQARSAANSF
jgi:hypothetical protein